MNYKIVLEYEGTRYNGWQRQTSTPNTIQGIIEDAIYKATGESVEINGSGRTDAGTHALGQVANFKLKNNIDNIMDRLNDELPSDIRILSCNEVDDRFHARLNAVGKTYIYKIDTAKKVNVFTRRTVNHFNFTLNMEEMKRAAALLTGTHDFKSFCSNKRTKKSTVRTIYSIDILSKGTEIDFVYKGDGFLYNMVRILTGTILEVGLGKIKADDVTGIIEAKDRSKAGMTMPPRGLILAEVKYKEEN